MFHQRNSITRLNQLGLSVLICVSLFLGLGNHHSQCHHFWLPGPGKKLKQSLLEELIHLKIGEPAVKHLETGLAHIFLPAVLKIYLITKARAPDLKILTRWGYVTTHLSLVLCR